MAMIDPVELSPNAVYRILTGCVLPRPIAWVSTMDCFGNRNLAPFSYFTVASVNPPVLCFSPLINEASHPKDTLKNIRQTGEFVVNIVSFDLVEAMNQTSAAYPPDVSEFSEAGLHPIASAVVKPPGVKESRARFECSLRQILSFGGEPMAGNLILGDVRFIHLHPDIYRGGRIDLDILDPVGRLAGNLYATTRDRFGLPRPETGEEAPGS